MYFVKKNYEVNCIQGVGLENNITIGCCVGIENDKEIRKELEARNRYDSSGRTSHTIRKYLEAYPFHLFTMISSFVL